MNDREYKELSMKEFTKAASVYETRLASEFCITGLKKILGI